MTVSYSNPANSDTDAVRWMLGDTNLTDAYLQDEEIAWALTQESTIPLAAAMCAEAIAGKLARLADISMDDTSIQYSQRHAHYMDLASRLRDEASSSLADASGGGPGSEGMFTGEDREPFFDFGQFDYDDPVVEEA